MAQRVGVVLSPAERELLAVIAADRNRAQKQVERARIVLAGRIGIRHSRWRKALASAGRRCGDDNSAFAELRDKSASPASRRSR